MNSSIASLLLPLFARVTVYGTVITQQSQQMVVLVGGGWMRTLTLCAAASSTRDWYATTRLCPSLQDSLVQCPSLNRLSQLPATFLVVSLSILESCLDATRNTAQSHTINRVPRGASGAECVSAFQAHLTELVCHTQTNSARSLRNRSRRRRKGQNERVPGNDQKSACKVDACCQPIPNKKRRMNDWDLRGLAPGASQSLEALTMLCLT